MQSTVGQASQAFAADFKDYSYKGQSNKVRTHEYKLPDDIAEHVLDVSPFTQFSEAKTANPNRSAQRAALVKRGYNRNTLPLKNGPESCHHGFQGTRNGSVTPACRGDLYGTAGITGKADDPALGIFALASAGGLLDSDLTKFLKTYVPAQANYKVSPAISIVGGPKSPDRGDEEAALDIDTAAGTLAPIPIRFIVSGDETEDFFTTAFQGLVNNKNRPAVVSLSYGIDEA